MSHLAPTAHLTFNGFRSQEDNTSDDKREKLSKNRDAKKGTLEGIVPENVRLESNLALKQVSRSIEHSDSAVLGHIIESKEADRERRRMRRRRRRGGEESGTGGCEKRYERSGMEKKERFKNRRRMKEYQIERGGEGRKT
ncbi:hypothetical protein CIHG_05751 [Coccidioides immitis H538.4]|uniref:Uncharacterized protein n=1 Tax=Coccidioides immitis H538.4 TaxID=396776 RepID=A0A0J8UKF9_COCIT|nr:hypothetical protein CIHG_05751 [Coccidioides immitis H538.4]